MMSFVSIGEYISTLDEKGKNHVSDFVNFMKEAFPNLSPKISFSMPMWWIGSKMNEGYVAVSTAKKTLFYSFSWWKLYCKAKTGAAKLYFRKKMY